MINKKLKYIVPYFLFVIGSTLLYVLTSMKDAMPYDGTKRMQRFAGLSLFYNMQTINWFFIAFLFMIIFPAGISIIYLKCNHGITSVIPRRNYHYLVYRNIVTSFLGGVCLQLVILFTQIVCIEIFYAPFIIQKNSGIFATIFNNDEFVSFLVYIILSILGVGVFSTFIFMLGLFIKRFSLFLLSGLITGLTLTMIPGFALTIFPSLVKTPLMYIIFLPNLISPSAITLGGEAQKLTENRLYLFTLIGYLSFIIILAYLFLRNKDKPIRRK